MTLKIYKERKPPSIRHIIGVAAGKGGVGKSSLTALLAMALHAQGFKVGVLDADLYGPSMRKIFPETEFPKQEDKWLIPALCQNIPYMSMAFFKEESKASAVRAPIANGLITQFIKGVAWGDLDILFIDFPPGTGDIHLTICQQAPLTGVVIVTTPQEMALIDVRKCVHMFDQLKVPLLGIVENMAYYQPERGEKVYLFGKEGGMRLAKETETPLLATIPIDPKIGELLDSGKSLFDQSSMREQQKIFLDLATEVFRNAEHIKYQNAKALKEFELVWKTV